MMTLTKRKSNYTREMNRHFYRAMIDEVKKFPTSIPSMEVSEWAEKRRVLPPGLTSLPGPFRWDVAPYMREIADCLSESSSVREVAVMKGAQVTFTVGVLENYIGYTIDVAPGPMLFISADAGVAETAVELKVDRMIESAGLQGRIYSQAKKQHNKKTGDTKAKKEFPGGFLLAAGPRSGSKLRMNAIQKLVFDEVDAYPEETGKEGDPIALGVRRTDSYEATRKILYGSTPLEDHTSKIKPLFEMGDQRYYMVPCKVCGHKQRLVWDRMKYEVDERGRLVYDSVHYECEHCHAHWTNADKAWFLPRGEWVPTAEAIRPNMRSYHISSLYSPIGMRTWASICEEWIAAKSDPLKLKAFVNTVLGETWVERGQAPSPEKIMLRRENYAVGTCPGPILVVTIGADVQKDRIECEVVGWSKDKENWSISYHVLQGDTQDVDGPAWRALHDILTTEHAGKPAMMALIDMGYNAPAVYQFCEQFVGGVYPVSGDFRRAEKGSQVFVVREVTGYQTQRIDLQSDFLKIEVYNMLNRGTPDGLPPTEPMPGYCHFPVEYTAQHFKQLTAEDRVMKKGRDGRKRPAWHLPEGRRNEQLDCRNYAYGALNVLAYFTCAEQLQLEQIDWDAFWQLAEKFS